MIKVPKLFDLYKTNKSVQNYRNILTNLFQPLFKVTNDPAFHPALHRFLQYVVGIEDESKSDHRRPSVVPLHQGAPHVGVQHCIDFQISQCPSITAPVYFAPTILSLHLTLLFSIPTSVRSTMKKGS